MDIKRIHLRDTSKIRKNVLAVDKAPESYEFSGDTDANTFHLGAFVDSNLVSVASFYHNKNTKFDANNQFQLQGMATLEKHRRQGLSKELLNAAFPIIKQNFCDLVWCNARISAVPFYEKLGFKTKGEEFEVEGIGKHILMCKEIS